MSELNLRMITPLFSGNAVAIHPSGMKKSQKIIPSTAAESQYIFFGSAGIRPAAVQAKRRTAIRPGDFIIELKIFALKHSTVRSNACGQGCPRSGL